MQQGLAPTDRDDGNTERSEFVDPSEHLRKGDGLGGVVELVAVRAGEIAAPDRDDLREHRAGALLHGGGEHAHLATAAVDRA